MNLEELRAKVDGFDRQIVELLNKRYEVVREIGAWKQEHKAAAYAPEREAQLMKELKKINKGPMTNEILHAIFREIITGSYSFQRIRRVVFVGYESSFASFAVRKYFGPQVEFTAVQETAKAIKDVETGRADIAFIPVDSVMEKTFGSYLEPIIASDSLQMCNAVMVPVELALLSIGRKQDIRCIYAHPQAFIECRDWLAQNFPHVEKVELANVTSGLKLASEQEGVAIISTPLAAEKFGLHILEKNIQKSDTPPMCFGIVSKHLAAPTGNDRTRICCGIKDRPGAIMECLTFIKEENLNVMHIESHKTKHIDDEFILVIDISGYPEDAGFKRAFEKLKKSCNFAKVIGVCAKELLKDL